MNSKQNEVSDKITLLVFKDNFAARTFQIPLKWISQFGIMIGIVTVFALSCLVFAARYYWIAAKSSPAHVRDLELEISDLRNKIKILATKPTEAPKPEAKTSSLPVSALFSAFPPSVSGNLPDPASLNFVIQNPETFWRQDTLGVRFTLQYRATTDSEEGSQQGRVFILARGPDTLLAYPPGVLTRSGSPNLINPEEGESFSVSRFREVRADFGPLPSKETIQELEIYIFNKEGQQILTYQKLSLKESE